MINPDLINYGLEALGAMLPAFAVGAAIFRVNGLASKDLQAWLVEKGHFNVGARQQADGADAYIYMPTGSRMNVKLGQGNFFQVADLRKAGKLLLARGAQDQRETNFDEVIDMIKAPQTKSIKEYPGVDVRYLGAVDDRLLKDQDPKVLFEQSSE